ncbi:MAG: tetratricopeptide repeat-containing sensor histidine kinase [Ignavibacteriaceae bacterium]
MKNVLKILLLVLLPIVAYSQKTSIDSLRNALHYAKDDSVKWNFCGQIARYFYESNRDSSLKYINKGLLIAEKNNKVVNVASNLTDKGYQLTHLGRFAEAFECFQKAFTIVEDSTNETKRWEIYCKSLKKDRLKVLSTTDHMYAILMGATGNIESEISYFNQAKAVAAQIDDTSRIMLANMDLGYIYLNINEPDSALWYESRAESSALQINEKDYLCFIYDVLGKISATKADTTAAIKYFYKSKQSGIEHNNYTSLFRVYNDLTKLYLAQKNKDSSLYYALKGLETYKTVYNNADGDNYYLLSESYGLNNLIDSSYKYRGLAIIAKDSANSKTIRNLEAFQTASLNENIRLEQLEKDRVARENRIRMIILLTGIAVFIFIALLLYRNNRNRKKANEILRKQKEEIEVQKKNAERTLGELKSTQAQLIHSEKMASLGELTAGIAHEIKNPLNFINNFSEVSSELIDEMKEELLNGNKEEVIAISDDLKQNLDKINHHGKRADSIVKGMLLHSRGTTGEKILTEINELLEQDVNLAYHGMRAQDKDFNITIEKDYDETLEKINVVPQDISRVFLNIINNACYAANEKKKKKNGGDFEPKLKVSTKNLNGKVEIRIGDNGNGIPKDIVDKIFQPFFTTKPTGEGTGLGLSLSYDIVTKVHGGELKVETKEGNGTTFIIQIPG